MNLNLPPIDENFIPYGRQVIDDQDCDAVIQALKSGNLTQGRAVDLFEEQLAAACGAPAAIAVTNGTAALHLAVSALDINPGSIAITTPITFAATANALLYCGIRPVFTEVDDASGLMCMDSLQKIIKKLDSAGTPAAAVLPVHYSGAVCDMERLWSLKDTYGFQIIEDASHALGARYASGKIVGSDSRSEFCTFSFHPVKHIATGEGGAIVTHSQSFRDNVTSLRSHGITRDPRKYSNRNEAFVGDSKEPLPWYYEMQSLGYNYRMPDINAALGISQLSKFPQFIERRRRIASIYDRAFKTQSLLHPISSGQFGTSSYHLYVIKLTSRAQTNEKLAIVKDLRRKGIGTQVHYIPVPQLPYYENLGYSTPASARQFYQSCLSIPMFAGLNDADANKVATEVISSVAAILA